MTVTQPQVLVVDDSPLLAAQLQQMLATFALLETTVHAPDAAPVLAAGVTVAFIEIQLLHDNGFQLARQLRAAAGCHVVLLSGSGRVTDLQWGLRAGARAVLTRPLQMPALRQTLTDLGVLPLATGVH